MAKRVVIIKGMFWGANPGASPVAGDRNDFKSFLGKGVTAYLMGMFNISTVENEDARSSASALGLISYPFRPPIAFQNSFSFDIRFAHLKSKTPYDFWTNKS